MFARLINPTELSLLYLLFATHWGWTSPSTTVENNRSNSSTTTTASNLLTSSQSPGNCSPLNCSGAGSCMVNTTTNTAECICREGYTGTYCEVGPCYANPCPRNVSCFVISDAPYCQCQGNVKGLNCTEDDPLVTCQDKPIPIYFDLQKASNTPVLLVCMPTNNTSGGDPCHNPGEGIVYTLRNESSFLEILRQGNNSDCLAVNNTSSLEHTSYTILVIATEEDDVLYRPSRFAKLVLELTFNKDPIINSSVFVFNVDGRENLFNFTIQVVDPEMQNIRVYLTGVFPQEYKSIVKNVGNSTQFQVAKPNITIPDIGVDVIVQIKVNDSGLPTASTRGNITLKLVSLVCSVSNNSNIYVDITADLSKAIATISCIKKGYLNLVYSISQSSNGALRVSGNDTSAQVYLAANSVSRYQTIVYVDASIDPANSRDFSVPVSMNVTVADLKPKCSSKNLTYVSISENSSVGLCSDVVYTCQNNLSSSMTCRVLNPTIVFNLSCVISASGTLSLNVCNNQSLHGRVGNFSISAVVENIYGGSDILNISVMVININDAPRIAAGPMAINVPEDAPVNFTILSLNITDDDLPFGDTLMSSINSTDISVPFRIVERERDVGNKVVVFDVHISQALNASRQQVYNLTIRVQDKAGLSTTTLLTVNVIDVNQPPICPSSVLIRGNITTSTGTILGTVQCDDVDFNPNFKSINYTIATGEPQVVKDTLSVYLNGSIALTGVMRNIENISSFRIEAMDNGGLKANVTVYIVLNSNFPPRCSPSDVAVNISENIPANHCFTAPNPCVNPVDNDQLIFTNFTGNGTNSLFQNNVSAKELAPCTKIALKGQIGIYVINLEVRNSYGAARLSIYVMILDENDPPVFNTTKYVTSIEEEKPLGTTLLYITATDPDTGDLGIISFKSDGMPAFFKLNGTTGEISVAGRIDAEALATLNVTFITQAVSGEFAVNVTVTIIIIDINDNDPKCSNPNPDEVGINVFDSPGKLIYSFSCSDTDVSPQYNTLVFIMASQQSVFNISQNGEVKIVKNLPLINGNYSLQVKVQDNDTYVRQSVRGLNTSLNVVVNTNYPPKCNPLAINETLAETWQTSCISREVICTDPTNDTSKNSTLQVGKAIGNASSFLEIKGKATAILGQIGLSVCQNSSIKGMIGTFQLKTIVSNVLGQTEVVWLVTVDDVNEAPYFSLQSYVSYAMEGYRNATMEPLLVLEVFDPDNSTPAFQLSNDSITASLLYPVDPQSIVLKGNILYRIKILNATLYNEYKFALTVTDKQGLTGNATATVFVNDTNEVPICPQTSMTAQTSLDAPAGVTLLHIFCYDTDREEAYRRLDYTLKLADQNFSGIFSVNSTGHLILLNKFPHSLPTGNAILQVQVSDEGTPPLSTNVTVNVSINRAIPAKCNPNIYPPLSWVVNSCLTLTMNCSDPTASSTSHLLYTFTGNFSVGFNLTETAALDGVFKFCYTLVGAMYDNTYLINVSVNNDLVVVTYPVAVAVVYQASTPRFSSQSYNIDVGENTTAQQTILNVSATVQTGTVSYSIIDDNSTLGGYFRINDTTGIVTSTKDLMPISNQNVTLKVKALNPESQLTSTATVFIRVIDINSPPVCNITQTEYNISVTTAVDTVIFSVSCSDMDTSSDNSHVTYSISGSNVDSYFQLKENMSLTLRTKTVLSVTANRYTITFTAQDSGMPTLKFQKILSINVNLTPPAPVLTAVSTSPSIISVSWEYTRPDFVNITNGFVLSVNGGATDTRYEFPTNVNSKDITSLSPETLYSISVTAVTKYGNVTATKNVSTKAIPVITSLTFTIRLTGMVFSADLRNSSTITYNTTREQLLLAFGALLGHFQGYSGVSVLSFRKGSVIVDAKVSVDQTGNISTIQAAIKQSVSSGFIGLNGTMIAVDSTYFVSFIGDGYSILDSIANATGASGIYDGNILDISCIVTVVGNVQPMITWKYKKNIINPVNGSRISISEIHFDFDIPQLAYSILSFRPTLSSDSGTYECIVMDQYLRPSSMNVSVYVMNQPDVSIQPLTQTVDAGATVNITCAVQNNVPLTRMVWYRDGAKFNSSSKLPEETFLISGSKYILTRRNITSGTVYECQGENEAGSGNKQQSNISVTLPGTVTCNNETDERGTHWTRTLQGTDDIKSCPAGMSGQAKRNCLEGGVWQDASYDNCVNNELLDLQTQTDNIKNGLAPNTVQNSLVMLTNVTNPNSVELQKAEVNVVSNILDNVVQISVNTKNITNNDVENFLQIASNVIDEKNKQSWQALIDEDKEGASVVLNQVEQYSRLKAQLINSSGEPVKRFQKKNLLVEIGHKPTNDIQFPSTSLSGSALTNGSFSGYILSQNALSNGNVNSYSGAYFNNVSGIIRKNVLRDGSITIRDDLGINSAVLSLQLDPRPALLNPSIRLTFKHFSAYYSNPVCSFWKFNADGNGTGAWSSEGCTRLSTSDDTTVCECNHLTNFAILMSPGKTPDKDELPLSIISIIGCAISIFCLAVTMIAHVIVWRYVKSDRAILLMNLCLALIISYVIFLAGVNQTENKNACTAVAALLHYFYLSVFFLMLAYGIELAVTVVYVFETRSRVRWLLPLAWILPAVVVAVSLGVTKLEGYGNDKFCWLSVDDGLIWAFVGPAALVIVLNFIIIIVVLNRMFRSSAMLTKSEKVKAITAARSLCVLLPITGITWVFGILSVNEDLVVFQYLFAIINSLQGLFISLFYCFFNRHLREAMKQINAARKRSHASFTATLKSSSRSSGQIRFDSIDDSKKNNSSDIIASSKNPFLQADRQMQKLVEKYAKDDQPISGFAVASDNFQNKRGGGDVSIEDVKISNILHETEVRNDLDHTDNITISPLISTTSSSFDKDTGESKNPRQSYKYDDINDTRQQVPLEQSLSKNLRTSSDGEDYLLFGQKSSQVYDKLVPKSGLDPRYDQNPTSSNEKQSVAQDKGIISSWQKQSTALEKMENENLKRASKDEVQKTGQSASFAEVPISKKPSKESKGQRRSSKSRKSDEEYKSKEAKKDKYVKKKGTEPEPKQGRTSNRMSKSKDIPPTKKRSRDRSQDYEYSAYDLAYLGPQVYPSSVENVAEYVTYNPYVGVYAYGSQQMSPVDPWQYYQPHGQQPRKKYW